MYLVALPISELDLCSVDQWDPKKIGKWKGYQRGLVKDKIKNLAHYLERPEGILPVPGLLNVRQKRTLSFSGPTGTRPVTGTLTILDDTRLWVVDMQHRIEGIRLAHSEGFLRDFPVPVLITEGLSGVKEAAQFYIINTRSKRMGVDLTRRLLIEHNEIRDITDVRDWELKAVQICIRLNRKLRDNPWYGRIREPESERMRDHIATEKSFVPSLRWLLTTPKARRKSPTTLARFLALFWGGLRANVPAAFESPRAYLIQKTPGFMAFHRIAPIVFRRYPKSSRGTYERLLRPFGRDPRFGQRFWLAKNPKGAKRYGTGQSAYANLAIDLKRYLGL